MPSEHAKAVRKEESEDDLDELSLSSLKKSTNATTKSLSFKEAKVKKEVAKSIKDESENELPKPTKQNASNKSNKGLLKKKLMKKEEVKNRGTKGAGPNGKKKERKVYDLPGQKRDPPEERDPLRIFYESLYKQVPGSEMAAFWMMESGLLPVAVARKIFEKKQKRNQQQKLSSPMKTVVTVKKSADSVTVERKTLSSPVSVKKKKTPDSKVDSKQTKKRKVEDGGSDDEFVLSRGKTNKKQKAS